MRAADITGLKIGLLEDPRIPNFRSCLQCGKCTSVCPAAHAYYVDGDNGRYNPREIVQILNINPEYRDLDDYAIENCYHCYTCKSVCPVGNSVSDIRPMGKELPDGVMRMMVLSVGAVQQIKAGYSDTVRMDMVLRVSVKITQE